jgi:DNA-binding response OmpR family regulator
VAVLYISGHPVVIGDSSERVLEKPFTPSELVERVSSVLARVA